MRVRIHEPGKAVWVLGTSFIIKKDELQETG
jgi:hypothetical protein